MDKTPRAATHTSTTLILIALVALLLAACGGSGAPTQTVSPSSVATPSGARTVEMEMMDIAFSPTSIDVAVGETIQFTFTNNGKIQHEATIGDKAFHEEHEMEMMASMAPGATQMGMDGEGKMTLEPGASGSIDYTFDTAGTFYVACHEPGHYAAGMITTVNVR